jgi:hypothetical protein
MALRGSHLHYGTAMVAAWLTASPAPRNPSELANITMLAFYRTNTPSRVSRANN